MAQMPQDPQSSWIKIIDLVPHILWAAAALTIFFIIGPDRIRDAFTRTSKIGFAGIEIELRSEIEKAATERKIPLPFKSIDRISERLERLRHLVAGTRILWIDDNPHNNTIEISVLHNLGATIDLATNNNAAQQHLNNGVYDLVLSDMARGGDDEAGLKFLPQIKDSLLSPPIIFYVGKQIPVTQDAFGITVRPDELFHLILDAFERRRS